METITMWQSEKEKKYISQQNQDYNSYYDSQLQNAVRSSIEKDNHGS
jgi:hypothetical protein